MSEQMNHVLSRVLINEIEQYVPLEQNPNRTMDLSGNQIIVVTRSGGSMYNFLIRDDMTCYPTYFNNIRIHGIITDSLGHTISNLNGENLYKIDLQGNIVWTNESILDMSRHYYESIYYNEVTIFNGDIIRKKIIKDNICPIKFEPIEEYDIYMNCVCCKHNFFEDEIRRWLLINPLQNKTCPTCRSPWNDNNIYVNRE